MNATDLLSAGLMRSTETRRLEAQSAIPSALFLPQPLSEPATADASTLDGDSPRTRDVRSVVERRFKRMNEAHDRIRTELLAEPPPQS